jgi:hypothetical protein
VTLLGRTRFSAKLIARLTDSAVATPMPSASLTVAVPSTNSTGHCRPRETRPSYGVIAKMNEDHHSCRLAHESDGDQWTYGESARGERFEMAPLPPAALARISHTNGRIGSPNQRRLLCCNDFTQVRGAPDADRV